MHIIQFHVFHEVDDTLTIHQSIKYYPTRAHDKGNAAILNFEFFCTILICVAPSIAVLLEI